VSFSENNDCWWRLLFFAIGNVGLSKQAAVSLFPALDEGDLMYMPNGFNARDIPLGSRQSLQQTIS